MEYRLNPKTGVIYTKDEYKFIEVNKEFFSPNDVYYEPWENLDLLPITTEDERKKLQYIYVQENQIEQAAKELLDYHNKDYRKQIENAGKFKRIPCDLLSDFVHSRNHVGRPHFSRDPETN